MTEHHGDDELDQRLSAELADLHRALERTLDLEAGLADATLPGRVTTLIDALDEVLDLDAGLAAIISPPPRPEAPTRGGTTSSALHDFAELLAVRPARERLQARTWLPRRELDHVRVVATVRNAISENLRSDISNLAKEIDNARQIVRIVLTSRASTKKEVLELEDPLAHTNVLEHCVSAVGERSTDLAQVAQFAQVASTGKGRFDSTDPLHFVRANADKIEGRVLRLFDIVDAIRNTIIDEVDDDDDLATSDRITSNIRKLADALEFIGGQVRVLEELRRDVFDIACFLRSVRRENLSKIGDSPLGRSFTAALEHDEGLSEHEDGQALIVEAIDLLERAVTDLTGADLAGVDLVGVPLEGVRWSSTTRWPSNWVEVIHGASVQTAPDLWVITGGRAKVDDIVGMPN